MINTVRFLQQCICQPRFLYQFFSPVIGLYQYRPATLLAAGRNDIHLSGGTLHPA